MNFLNWFIDPVKNHYADFSGRASRKDYWMFALVYVILSAIVAVIEGVLHINFLGIIFALIVLVPVLAIGARRLHDTGLSGWWQLLSLIPVAGALILMVLLVRKGEESANKYGMNPHLDFAPTYTSSGQSLAA